MPKSKKQPQNVASKALFSTWLRGSKSAPAIMTYKNEDAGEQSTLRSFDASLSTTSSSKVAADDTCCFASSPNLSTSEISTSNSIDRAPPEDVTPSEDKGHDHEELYMVIGISRKSSRPAKLYFEAQTAECYDRAGKYVDFYIRRCHRTKGQDNCCQPRKESIVIFGSSNTDFENSKANGIEDLRRLLCVAEPGQKIVLVCSQTDGLCTNMVGFAGFLKRFLDYGIRLELMVWWSNTKFDRYDLGILVSQFNARTLGGMLDPYYQSFLGTMARVATNKESMAQASRANKSEGLGNRNVKPIDPDDEIEEPDPVIVPMSRTAKLEHLRESLESSRRAVNEIPVSKNEGGIFVCPTDGRLFKTFREVVDHLVKEVMAMIEWDRRCMFCDAKFEAPRQSSRARKHLKRHIFEKLNCPESDSTGCRYYAKTEDDMDSHLSHVHCSDETIYKARSVQCADCEETFTMQYHLKRHYRNVHNAVPATCEHCGFVSRNDAALRSHVLYGLCSALPHIMTECEICSGMFSASALSLHIRKAHTQAEQIAVFGDIMKT